MNSVPLMRETMVQNWSVLGAMSRRRTSTSSMVSGSSAMKIGRTAAPPPSNASPRAGWRQSQDRAEESLLSNHFALASGDGADHRPAARSEEHTSELQSQSNLVCRL